MDGARLDTVDPKTLTILRELERKVLWLSTYMIHHANHEVDRGDGLKVGGHQASSAMHRMRSPKSASILKVSGYLLFFRRASMHFRSLALQYMLVPQVALPFGFA